MEELEIKRFVADWADAWNAREIDRLIEHFAPDVVFNSPIAALIIEGSDGVVRGKDALRAYWTLGASLIPDLRFELLGTYAGVDTLVIHYRNQGGGLVCEVLRFVDGLVVEGHGTYLVP